MKKIWFAVLALFVVIILAGCQESDDLSFKIEVVDLDGTVLLSDDIIFYEDDEQSIVELIDVAVGLDYSSSAYGTFVNGIADFYPTEYQVTYNYYYALYIDDVMSMTGIDDVVIKDGMKISFVETTMLDETDLFVDYLIQSWLESYTETYINSDVFEYHVLAAIKQLNIYGYESPLLSSQTMSFSPLDLARDTIANTFKASIFEKALGLNLDATKTALSGFESGSTWDACSLLTALRITQSSQTQIDSVLADLVATASQTSYLDADYAGMVLLALAPYKDDSSTTVVINFMIDYIQTTLTSDGVQAYGNPNASSTAAVVLGLVAQGINPRGEDYTTEGTDLIEALIKYELFSSFKWLLTDEQADMNFSTPQVFSALVAYKIYRDVWGNPAFDLFNF